MKSSARFHVILTVVSFAASALVAAPDSNDAIFNYDRTVPLNVQEVGREIRGRALIRDITFSPADKPVKAFLVSPVVGNGPHAAILYIHWLGEPKTTNRTEFLEEATMLASHGVISLLVDTMWAEPNWYKNRVPEEDYGHAIRQVIELRRAMDLLLSQPGIDVQRFGFVAHDFGAMYGIVASSLDRRAKTYVFMAGIPHFIDWFLFATQPKDLAAYRLQIGPIDPVNYVGRLAPASIFFQFANTDQYVNAAQAAEFYAAAGPRKHMATYVAGHDLHTEEVAADRVAWLKRELALKP